MFFTSFASGPLSPLSTTGVAVGSDGTGLDQLLAAFDGVEAGFSAELQSVLHQMSPRLMQRLESMLAGGMPLPQAARQLLVETAGQRQTAMYQGMSIDATAPGGAADRPGAASVIATPIVPSEPRPSRIVLPRGLAETLPSAPMSALLHAATLPGVKASGQPAGFTSQLAANLLDMGVPQSVGGRDWQGAIAERVVWMGLGDRQFARLTLNPPHLGPLEVRVSVSQDQTSVHFLAGHAAVREALEAAMPRLRELFDQQSMSLVHAEVSDPGARRDRDTGPSARGQSMEAPVDDGGTTAEAALDIPPGQLSGGGRGLIDLFV